MATETITQSHPSLETESEDLSFPLLPPFPLDILTAPLHRLSLANLRSSPDESNRLFSAAKDLGFFYLDLRGDPLGERRALRLTASVEEATPTTVDADHLARRVRNELSANADIPVREPGVDDEPFAEPLHLVGSEGRHRGQGNLPRHQERGAVHDCRADFRRDRSDGALAFRERIATPLMQRSPPRSTTIEAGFSLA